MMATLASASLRADRKAARVQAALAKAVPRQHGRAGQVDGKCPRGREQEGSRIGRNRVGDLAPSRPERRQPRQEQQPGQTHADHGALPRAPAQGEQDEQVDGGILQEVHAVGEYASAWLKCHHPDVFCAALLNSQPMGFYAPAQVVRDAQEHGVLVRPVCVNRSRWDCTLEPRAAGDGEDGGRGESGGTRG